MDAIFTIGYEKADPRDFIATLVANDIDTLLDIRERAMSRRRGFAKTALRENLAAADIGYQHEPALGSPSEIRYALRENGDYKRFFCDFNAYLKTQEQVIESLTTMPGRIVLLCYERASNQCHRSSVAKVLADKTGLGVKNLGVKPGLGQSAGKAARTDSREGVPAA